MTTVPLRRPDTRGGPARHAVSARDARRRRWSASWRAALRLAARDARRHRSATVAIVLMIGLPVLIISAGSAVLATTAITPVESLPAAVGRGSALLTDQGPGVVQQAVDGQVINILDEDARTIGGHRRGEPWTTGQLEQLTGGTLGVTATTTAFVGGPTAVTRVPSLVLGRAVMAGSGLAELVDGRLPEAPGEVAVTEQGLAAGLPARGPIELSVSSNAGRAQITGVVRARSADFQPVGLVLGEDWLPADDVRAFLLLRDRPVSWSDVETWNAYGLSVLSPAVIADPPAGAPAGVAPPSALNRALVVVIALGLVLETALLAGPAFAVSAARRRRSLALIASNGADRAQLSRYVLAQGVLLGGLAVLVGALLGTALGWWTVRLVAGLTDGRGTTIGHPPLDTYGWATGLITVVAFVAAVISAAVPGRNAARLDIATTLAGRNAVARHGAGGPIVGGVIMIIGLTLVAISFALRGWSGLLSAGVGGTVMIIGSLFLLPMIIVAIGRLVDRMPALLRMAGRNTTRLRGRTVPAVSAIAVVVATLTMITTAAGSDDAQTRRDYLPRAAYGHGILAAQSDAAATLTQIERLHPDWSIATVGALGSDDPSAPGGASRAATSVDAVPPGCSAAETVAAMSDDLQPGRCQTARRDNGWQVTVADPGALNPAVRLTARQREVLDRGGLLVTEPTLIRDGTVRLAVSAMGTPAEGSTAPLTLRRLVEVPATFLDGAQLATLSWTDTAGTGLEGGLMLASGAERNDLPRTTSRWDVTDPAGPISRTDQSALNNEVVAALEVERGYESPTAGILAVLLGVAAGLVAVGALMSTALGQIEARTDETVLAALGAGVGFRRRLAAIEAALVAVLGSIVGVVVGLAPGLALGASLTTDYAGPDGVYPDPILVVPWWDLAALVVIVPIACALLAALLIRSRPALGRSRA